MPVLNVLENNNVDLSLHYLDKKCLYVLQKNVLHFLNHKRNSFRELIFVCIGTDRATGDSLGPLVGTRLNALAPNANIFGTLEEPVHAVNLEESLDKIRASFQSPLIVAIDACLGKSERVGYINFRDGGLKPGAALNKDLPEVGECHITGVVNTGGFLEQLVLQNTRLHIVYTMAEIISRALFLVQMHYNVNVKKFPS